MSPDAPIFQLVWRNEPSFDLDNLTASQQKALGKIDKDDVIGFFSEALRSCPDPNEYSINMMGLLDNIVGFFGRKDGKDIGVTHEQAYLLASLYLRPLVTDKKFTFKKIVKIFLDSRCVKMNGRYVHDHSPMQMLSQELGGAA